MKSARVIILLTLLPTAAIAGLLTAERKSQFDKAVASIMAASMPSVASSVIDRVIKDYDDATPNKAQAVELAEEQFWRTTEQESVAAAGDRALEGCQLRYGKPCALVAINDEIVSEGSLTPKDMPRLHYAGKYDVSQIPIVRLSTRKWSEVQFYDKAMEPKAIAIHPRGRLFISAGNPTVQDAERAALTKCNNDPVRKGRDGGCFLYAINNDVVVSERRMAPK
ncbi:MAG TPA: hypothetical protein VKY22_29315 [Bradyrhizobium sp.]|nr:hypothetical protein [Bradyrhizobium sp.]